MSVRGRVCVVVAVLGLAPSLACDRPASSDVPARSRVVSPAVDVGPRPNEAEPRSVDALIGVLVPAAEITLASDRTARVMQLELDVGAHVTANQVIATLEAHDERIDIEAAAAAWRASVAELAERELELARARSERIDVEQLQDYVSQAEVRERQQAEALSLARRRRAVASLDTHRSSIARAKARLAESELRAPFSGRIAERNIDVGAMVTAGEAIMRLLADARLVRFAVPEAAAARLRLGAPVQVSFEGPELVLMGVVTMVAPEVDAATRLVLAEASFADDTALGSLRVGTVASVRFVEAPP